MSRKHEEWGTRVRGGFSYRKAFPKLYSLVIVNEVKKVTLTRFLISFFKLNLRFFFFNLVN